jgi:urease accessory protein
MIVIEQRYAGNEPTQERLVLPFDLRCKSRLRTKLASGEEAGLFLERGAILRGGDRLRGNDGRIVEVVAAPEQLIEVRTEEAALLARAAYHLGNRHMPVQVGDGWLRLAADSVLEAMLAGLGLQPIAIEGPFEPEAGAYAPGHQHGHSSALSKIHQYGQHP